MVSLGSNMTLSASLSFGVVSTIFVGKRPNSPLSGASG